MSTASHSGDGLKQYVQAIEQVLDSHASNRAIIREVSKATKDMCLDDRWLAEQHRLGDPDSYTRHLLHKDPRSRFIVLSLVWQPGQMTAIHDHDCWGVMGIVNNRLEEICYDRVDDRSRPGYCELEERRGMDVSKGRVSYLLPPHEEIHKIGNVSDKPTISLHVYGRDLDVINVFDAETGEISQKRIDYPEANGGKKGC